MAVGSVFMTRVVRRMVDDDDELLLRCFNAGEEDEDEDDEDVEDEEEEKIFVNCFIMSINDSVLLETVAADSPSVATTEVEYEPVSVCFVETLDFSEFDVESSREAKARSAS